MEATGKLIYNLIWERWVSAERAKEYQLINKFSVDYTLAPPNFLTISSPVKPY